MFVPFPGINRDQLRIICPLVFFRLAESKKRMSEMSAELNDSFWFRVSDQVIGKKNMANPPGFQRIQHSFVFKFWFMVFPDHVISG